MTDTIDTARTLLKQHSIDLLQRANVVATGVGYKVSGNKRSEVPSIICSVTNKRPAAQLSARDLVPADIDGIATDVVETGIIRALQAPTERLRPAPGGISVGHRDITAGTLGCWVHRNGQWMMLSNNHVLANSNQARIGDPILQPGPHDGGTTAADQIAVLEDFVPVSFVGLPSDCGIAGRIVDLLNAIAGALGSNTRLQAITTRASDNLVDAAIARPLDDADVSPDILNIGSIQGTASAQLGMAIKKMGRTTGFTRGDIQQVDVTVNVQYGAGNIARFTDQLMAGPMSAGGDSGSAVLDEHDNIVGLLFAGSEQSTIINRIDHVFSALNIGL
jgi:hypothetical protein